MEVSFIKKPPVDFVEGGFLIYFTASTILLNTSGLV